LPTPPYVFLPHTTDAYIEAVGTSFEEALQNAAAALIDTMCNLPLVDTISTDEIQVEGENEFALLYDWLEAILLKFELEQKVYSQFLVKLTTLPSDHLRIKAVVKGERYDRRKHGSKVEVKAVTFHRMEISRTPSLTTLRFILDL